MSYDGRIASIVALEDEWLRHQDAINDWYVIWHLALRRRPTAMTELSRRLGSGGSMADSFSARGFARRAYRLGDPTAAYNLAMDYFNKRDLVGYRSWLRRAAALGAPDARAQFRRFEVRLPHRSAFDIGRGRPRRSYD